MRYRILGPLEVHDGPRMVPLPQGRQRLLLTVLLLHANRVVSRDRLIDALWGETPPPTAHNSLHNVVSGIRKGLGNGELVTRDGGYMLHVAPGELDADRFAELVQHGAAAHARGDPESAAALLREALELWRGPPLGDLAYHPALADEAARLEEARLVALEERIEADLARGHHADVVAELEALVSQHPLRERLRADQMLALYRCGRQADALASYRDARERLVDELGIEPGPALRRLEQAVLEQDPELGAPDKLPAAPLAVAWARRHAGALIVAGTLAVATAVVALVAALDSTPRGLPSISPEAVGVVDPQTGRIEAQLAFGGRPMGAVRAAGAVWIANGSRGTVARVDPDRLGIVDTVAVGGDTTAVAAADEAVWAVSSDERVVARISPRTNAVVARVRVGHGARAVTGAADSLWVANALDGTVTRIDPRTGRVTRTVRVGSGPAALAAGAGAVWVANEVEGSVTRIDPALGQVVARIRVGNGPSSVAFAAGSVWVTNAVDGTISRIDPAHDAVVATVAVGGTPRALQATGDTLWVGSDTTDVVVALDPVKAVVRRRLRIGNPVRSLVAVGDRLWVGVLAGPAAHRGGTLRIAASVSQGQISLDPARAWSTETWPLVSVIADGLVGYRRVGGAAGATLVPNLARALPPPEEAGTTYRFRLRPGLRYSDGRAVRAGDVRASIERLHRMQAPALSAYPLDVRGEKSCDRRRCNLSDGIQTDARSGTIIFRLRRPNPDFLLHLAVPVYSILPAGSALHPLGRDLIGTGPYRLTRADADRRLTLERNPRFRAWSPTAQPPGFPDRIEWNLRPSAAERESADIRYDPLPSRALRSLAVRAPDRIHTQITPGLQYLFLNTRVPPLNNRLARQAVATAVDRARLARLAFGESAIPTCQALPPVLPGYQPYCPFGRARGAPDPAPDLPAAQDLVRRSGSKGAAVTVTAPSDLPNQVRAAQALARTLKTIGWRARVSATRPVFGKSFPGSYTAAAARSREALIGWANWFPDLPTASKLLPPLASCARDGALTSLNYNLSGSCDPALDRVMRTAHALDTTDPAAAARHWTAADRYIVKNAAIIPIAGSEDHFVTSARVGNFQFNPAIFMLVSQMWVR
jgi:peptide/nickel transport system substrate-binding protein